MGEKAEAYIRAIRWKLGVPANSRDDERCWFDVYPRDRGFASARTAFVESLGKTIRAVLIDKMALSSGRIPDGQSEFIDALLEVVQEERNHRLRRALIAEVNAAVTGKRSPVIPERSVVRASPARNSPPDYNRRPDSPPPRGAASAAGHPEFAPSPLAAPVGSAKSFPGESTGNHPMKKDDHTQSALSGHESSLPPTEPMHPPTNSSQPVAEPPADLPPGAALWKYVKVSDNLDTHDDAWNVLFDLGGRIGVAGARARGRKHKHEGTNCDDWFEIKVQGPWTVIAVSDGAGSSRFSRVGAQASTRAAVSSLYSELASVGAPTLKAPGFWRGPEGGGGDTKIIKDCLHRAVHAAYHAVVAAFESRRENPEYRVLLNRELALDDLAGTLRLAVHRVVRFGGEDHDLVVACSIGDGMTAVIDRDHELHLLGSEEGGGKYSGETEFLTRIRNLEPEPLNAATFACWLPLRALMVMSDGIADPYFPNNPGMLCVYGDLLINGVIPPPSGKDGEVSEEHEKTIQEGRYQYSIERLLRDAPPERLKIRSSGALAQQLNTPIRELIKNPSLLRAAAHGETAFPHEAMSERLLAWLDSFYVRGEFDDRTLVILHRETA